MTGWDALWLAWLLIFVAVEWAAINSEINGRTFSERVWAWFAIDVDSIGLRKRGAWMWRLRRALLLAIVAWLSLHLLTGGAW